MIESVPVKSLQASINHRKDFYKAELLKMGYFKKPSRKQLHNVSLRDLEYIYSKERGKRI